MNPVDAQMQISVTLTAEGWNGVLQIMGESPMPYRVSAPLIQAIGQQLQQAAAEAPPRQNGHDINVPTRHLDAA